MFIIPTPVISVYMYLSLESSKLVNLPLIGLGTNLNLSENLCLS